MPNDSNSQDSPNPPIEAKALSDESVGEELARLEAIQLMKEELARSKTVQLMKEELDRSTTVANSTDIKNLKNAAIDLTEKQLASMSVIAKATAELDNLKRDQDAQDIIKIQIEQAIKDIQITQSEQEILHLRNQNDLAFLLREQRSKAEYFFAYRLIITTLCTTVLLSLAAGVWLTAVGVEIPQLLIVLSSSGLGAISGLLTPNPQAQKREIPVNRRERN
jgi:hypothetical protein